MRSETESSASRLQYATDGQVIGQRIKREGSADVLLLNDGFMWVYLKATGKQAVWDSKNSKVVKFARNGKPRQLSQNNAE